MSSSDKPRVVIVMGSESDRPFMTEAEKMLDELGIPSTTVVMSAHRTPAKVQEMASTARDRGVEVIIAGAGWAAALPGTIAAWTTLPVIGVPLATSDLNGLDALLAIVQMPPGIPVATVAIGKGGARNAAILAAQIIATGDEKVRASVEEHRQRLAGK
ncbi:MAG TPA: 5-(carboxyamino)imidazole ribonucleotide mutase [Thermomicrobiales bacterium]|nr:5-(carboxyamino)imidazole ribonucleotide mutase [Thermomicrobiales bacterium]